MSEIGREVADRAPLAHHSSETGSPARESARADSSQAVQARPATLADASAIARIYNEGIADGVATFETRHRSAEDIVPWIGSRFPTVVVVDCDVIGFATTSEYRPRECYAGVAEFSVYVARAHRGRGFGRVAMEALMDTASRAGFWKLVSRVFVENLASRALLRDLGFREVGIYERHARLNGVWRDVVIVERLLGDVG
jgi:L-amino acid N-acyltransferase YncA